GVLVSHEHGPAPLAAKTKALKDAENEQQDRRPDADLGVGWHEADQEGRNAHDHQRKDEHALAADAVAEVAEDNAAERARDKSDREGRISEHGRDEHVARRKIQ